MQFLAPDAEAPRTVEVILHDATVTDEPGHYVRARLECKVCVGT